MFKNLIINSLLALVLIAGLAFAQDQPKVYPVPVDRIERLKNALSEAAHARVNADLHKPESGINPNCRQVVTEQDAQLKGSAAALLMLEAQIVAGAPLGYVLDMEKWQFEPPDVKASKKEKVHA